jgi:hypothetical protein
MFGKLIERLISHLQMNFSFEKNKIHITLVL